MRRSSGRSHGVRESVRARRLVPRYHVSVSRRTIDEFETGFSMRPSRFKRRFGALLVTTSTIMTFLGGCTMDDNTGRVSDDVKALRRIIDLPIEVKSVHWEIFGTPEYTGGVPGPTDYMTLVAEIQLPNTTNQFSINPGHGSVYIVPEVARLWISSDFRYSLEKHKNSTLDLSMEKSCHAYTAKLKKTDRPVSGFACTKSDRVFLYLSLL